MEHGHLSEREPVGVTALHLTFNLAFQLFPGFLKSPLHLFELGDVAGEDGEPHDLAVCVENRVDGRIEPHPISRVLKAAGFPRSLYLLALRHSEGDHARWREAPYGEADDIVHVLTQPPSRDVVERKEGATEVRKERRLRRGVEERQHRLLPFAPRFL